MSKSSCGCLFMRDAAHTKVRSCVKHAKPQISLGGNIRKLSDIEEGNLNKVQGRAWPKK